jgi:hypothetical protein
MSTEKQKANNRKHYHENLETERERGRKYYFEHQEERRKYRLEHQGYNKNKEYNKKYYLEHKENIREQILKKWYSISVKECEEILIQQGGVCAICGNFPKKQRLDIDHDHKTGKVRGLLCKRCNLMLGNAEDNRSILQSALIYLIKAQKV